nr:hypothetical protein [Sphingomonas laterariae]
MLRESGHDPLDGRGYGVELRGAGEWATARALVAASLGWIEGGRPQGSELPGLFFANRDGVAIVAAEAEDDMPW